jgi:predicted DNA-binding protein
MNIMRNTRVYSITMPPEMARQAERLAKSENRTMSELFRETFRRYQREQEDRLFLADPQRPQRLLALKQVVDELRKEATKTGVSKLTQRQINAEIEAYRREQRKKARTKRPGR